MKARAFDYVRPASLAEALGAFRSCDGEARYVAGGQSLLAAMNMRLSAPDLLVDIARLPELAGLERQGDFLRIGALTRHHEILSSALVRECAPLLSRAATFIAHPAIRNRGTIGGSISLADPAAEYPAALVALDARIEVAGPQGARRIAAEDFFTGLYETALEAGEIVTAILVPVADASAVQAFDELTRRRGDYAMVGLAIAGRISARMEAIRLVFFAVGQAPVRARAAERVLTGAKLDRTAIGAARAAVATDVAPDDDVTMPGAARLHMAGVLLQRMLEKLAAGAAP